MFILITKNTALKYNDIMSDLFDTFNSLREINVKYKSYTAIRRKKHFFKNACFFCLFCFLLTFYCQQHQWKCSEMEAVVTRISLL